MAPTHPPLDPSLSLSTSLVRVRFCETDLMGIVHHGTHLIYFEAGRVEWLRKRGVTYADWAARGIHLPVVEANVVYKAPAYFDDELTVETRLTQLGACTLRYEYRLLRGETFLASGFTRLACVNNNRMPQRFSKEIEQVLRSGEQ